MADVTRTAIAEMQTEVEALCERIRQSREIAVEPHKTNSPPQKTAVENTPKLEIAPSRSRGASDKGATARFGIGAWLQRISKWFSYTAGGR